MNRIITSVSAAALAFGLGATAAHAEAHTAMGSMDLSERQGDLIRSRDITGGEVYSVSEGYSEWDSANVYDDVDTDWNDIGEIEDIVLSRDGQMIGIVAEVGGFLDIGDKHVMISISDVSLVAVDDKSYAYVTRLSEEQLEELPDVDEGFWD